MAEKKLKIVTVYTQEGQEYAVEATDTGGNEDGDLMVFLPDGGANIYNSKFWTKMYIRPKETLQ